MDVLPKTLREQLINEFGENILNINPVSEHTSQQVKKVLFRLPDSNKYRSCRDTRHS
jgi:23S rRNA (adenine-C8)-methyltransferase